MQRRNFVKLSGVAAALQCLPSIGFSQQGDVFRIGSLTPITGAGSPYGPGMQQAIRLAVDEVNAAGGAGGRKLELFTEDDQTKPDAAVLAAYGLPEGSSGDALLEPLVRHYRQSAPPESVTLGQHHLFMVLLIAYIISAALAGIVIKELEARKA